MAAPSSGSPPTRKEVRDEQHAANRGRDRNAGANQRSRRRPSVRWSGPPGSACAAVAATMYSQPHRRLPPSVPITNGRIQTDAKECKQPWQPWRCFPFNVCRYYGGARTDFRWFLCGALGPEPLLSAVLRREVLSAPATPSTPCSPPAQIGQTPWILVSVASVLVHRFPNSNQIMRHGRACRTRCERRDRD